MAELHTTGTPVMEPGALAAALGAQIDRLAVELLGEPSQRSAFEIRFGNRGSRSVVVSGAKRGSFFDHQCGKGGDALELVKVTLSMTTIDAMLWAINWLGMNPDSRRRSIPAATNSAKVNSSVPDYAKRVERALAIWSETVALFGTPAEAYLRTRRIVPPGGVVDLRFHPNCPVKTLANRIITLPAMVALMRDILTNEPRAIHRTFLKSDGSGKVDPARHNIQHDKMMLGPSGGAVIKLAHNADVTLGLGLSEGIENALTLGARGWWPMWAAGDAGHISRFPVLDGIECLTIFSDADDGGTGLDAARTCAGRWWTAGREATIWKPPPELDWNDALIGRAP